MIAGQVDRPLRFLHDSFSDKSSFFKEMGSDAANLHQLPLVMGGAGFSYQLHPAPESLPIQQILLRAFELGLRTIDTSPYYEPSEQLIGKALSDPEVASSYPREGIIIMTKVGRIKENQFDYSPAWIRKSVLRSLERFQTTYLDVVFCHDVEFVSMEDALAAVGVLFDLHRMGTIRKVGISGYDLDTLAAVATSVRERYGRPLDVIQTWAQLTLQNTQVEKRGLNLFRAAGVNSVFCSSPLAVGLLRNGGIPAGRTGDWHPAPPGLRAAAQQAALWTEQQGHSMASVALRFAISRARRNCSPGFAISTITGISTLSDLEQNVATAKQILENDPEAPKSTSLRDGLQAFSIPTWNRQIKTSAPLFTDGNIL